MPIPVRLADHSERFTAFALDWVIWTLLLLAIYLPLMLVVGLSNFTLIAISIALFIGFLVRNIYFVYFEIAWRGATPGKRIVGIRVIDRAGGPLLPSAVIARNLTREVEIFMPLGILMSGAKSGGTVDLMQLSIGVWLVFFAALPLINRDRMRGGDLIAGTMVIALPKLHAAERPRRRRRAIRLAFKRGPFYLAMETGAPIVPIVISGTQTMMRKHSAAIRPGVAKVEFLEAVYPGDFRDARRVDGDRARADGGGAAGRDEADLRFRLEEERGGSGVGSLKPFGSNPRRERRLKAEIPRAGGARWGGAGDGSSGRGGATAVASVADAGGGDDRCGRGGVAGVLAAAAHGQTFCGGRSSGPS